MPSREARERGVVVSLGAAESEIGRRVGGCLDAFSFTLGTHESNSVVCVDESLSSEMRTKRKNSFKESCAIQASHHVFGLQYRLQVPTSTGVREVPSLLALKAANREFSLLHRYEVTGLTVG